jgi:hypothetical protein
MRSIGMKASVILLWLLGITFLVVDGIYLAWSLAAGNLELIGVITIGLSSVMCFMFAFYFGRVRAARGAEELPEDRLDAEIDDGDPEIGHFSPWSWWPILLAGSVAIAALGLAISAWIMIIGVPLVVITIVGWTYEYYRGYHAR